METTPINYDKPAYHIQSIDSLRGLAAVSVFFFHMWSMNLPEETMYRPWFFLLAGHEAVVFFFVLSGFILTLSYEKGQLQYRQFFIRRLLRIYPAYYLSMIIGVIAYSLIQPKPLTQYTPWFNTQFSTIVISYKTFFDTLFLVTNAVSHINGAVWSLVYEVLISTLILPLFWKIKTRRGFMTLGFVYVLFFIYRQISHTLHEKYVIIDGALYFSVFFYAGFLVYHFREKLIFFSQLKFLPIYYLCYANIYFGFGANFFVKATIRDFFSGIGSVGFLCLALNNPHVIKFLSIKVINFYGKISYSFYLFHICIMYSIVYLLKDILPMSAMIALMFVITTIISSFMYYNVEKPFIRLGRRITT